MTKSKLFIHGVPDTPAVWAPLKDELKDVSAEIITPALPGFCAPLPSQFSPTKEGYVDWLISQVETLHAANGPIDIVGHDWGALLTLRVASLRPELIRSWAVSGGVIHPDYQGHKTAKLWATPILGELAMAVTSRKALKKVLVEAALPPSIAKIEVGNWTRTMRRCILSLYRSAKGLSFSTDWVSALDNLPKHGLVIWGEHDPYVAASFARSFAKGQDVPCHIVGDTGHWMIAERPALAAQYLRDLWAAS